MNRFIVVYPIMDYDDVQEIKYVASFHSREEADVFIEECRKTYMDSVKKRDEYISQYVDSIEEKDKEKILEEIKKQAFNYDAVYHELMSEVKDRVILKQILLSFIIKSLPNYNPPDCLNNMYYHYQIVEINGE